MNTAEPFICSWIISLPIANTHYTARARRHSSRLLVASFQRCSQPGFRRNHFFFCWHFFFFLPFLFWVTTSVSLWELLGLLINDLKIPALLDRPSRVTGSGKHGHRANYDPPQTQRSITSSALSTSSSITSSPRCMTGLDLCSSVAPNSCCSSQLSHPL